MKITYTLTIIEDDDNTGGGEVVQNISEGLALT